LEGLRKERSYVEPPRDRGRKRGEDHKSSKRQMGRIKLAKKPRCYVLRTKIKERQRA